LSDDHEQYLEARRALVDGFLRQWVRERPGCPARLAEAMAYSLLAPGKRLRPLLVMLAAEACGGSAREAVAAAGAAEMVHTYSLIHDDLPAMDDDDLRRGLPTCHKKFGEALAILAGDALLTMSFEVLGASYPAATARACVLELARGAGPCGMVGGQADDLAMEQRGGEGTLEELTSLHARKTGALILASLRMGLLVAQAERSAGADPGLHDLIDTYGRCLGLAFQVTDDLLDVQSTAEVSGKRVRKDAARGKLTFPGILGVSESRRKAKALCDQALEAVAPLGPQGRPLAALASRLLDRSR